MKFVSTSTINKAEHIGLILQTHMTLAAKRSAIYIHAVHSDVHARFSYVANQYSRIWQVVLVSFSGC